MTYPGVFILSLADVADVLKEDRPRVVKAWASSGGYWREYKTTVPDAYIIARQYWQHDVERGLVTAARDPGPLLSGLRQATEGQPFDAWVGPNEYIGEQDSDDAWGAAVVVEKRFAGLAKSTGRDYWALQMPVGHLPPPWVVEELAKDKNVTGFALHYYGLQGRMQDMPFAQRYGDFIRDCPLPVLLGEIGRDGWQENIGWQAQGITGAQLVEEMRWALDNLKPWAFTAFCYGGTQDWKDKGFELKDNAEFRDLIRTFDYNAFKRPERGEQMAYNEFHVEGSIPASNYGERDGTPINTIVIHSTRGGAATPEGELQATINWFKNPTSQVSAHLVIAANGDYWYCVPWEKAAYHAKTYNKRSIGIELVQQRATTPFTEAQYERLAEAIVWLRTTYGSFVVVGHDEIDPQKSDPGDIANGGQFDWGRIGIAAPAPPADMTAAEKLSAFRAEIQAVLTKYS